MTDVPLRVLIVEDNQSDAKLLERELQRNGLVFQSTRVDTEPKFIEAVATEPHLVLCDWQLPQFSCLRALELLQGRWPDTPFILVSGSIGEEAAVQIIKKGAFDYVLKNQLSRLVPSVQQALINRALKLSAQQALAALKESELRYRMLFESNPHPMWVYDLETLRFLAVNETAIRDYGYSREEFLGMTIRDIRPAEDIPRLEQAIEKLTSASTSPTRWRHRRKNGTIFDVEISSNTYTENGRPARLALALDVTERNKAQAALQESEERFRLAILATNDAVWSIDVSCGAVAWSDRYTALFNRHPETAASWQWWIDRIHPDDRERTTNSLQDAIKGTASNWTCEYRFKRADGEWADLHDQAYIARDHEMKATKIVGAMRDVTARNRVQSELMLRDRAMRAVTQGILISDAQLPNNPIIYASPGFEEMTGYKASEVIGKTCSFLQGKDTDPAAIKEIRTALRSVRTCHLEIRNYRKDGTPFWNELTISPVLNSAGVLTHFVGIQIDVTARRLLEEQLRQSQKLEAVGLLAGGIAHDFNNLLTVINGYSELLADNLAPGDYGREPLLAIRDAGERAATLTSQLLAFSRKAIVEPKILDLHEVVESVGRLLRRLIGEDINLIIDRIGSRARVLIDPGQVEQIIMNLVVNARDAMPLGGTIKITTARVHIDEMPKTGSGEFKAGDYVQMTVTDSGSGMSEDVRNRAFEPFFTTKEVGKGTGLGLSTVYGIVRQAGGYISIDSTLGSGTTIRLLFPALPASTVVEQTGSQDTTPPGTETVLLVEDEDRVRLLARLGLELQGYKVIEAESGARAIAAAKGYGGQIHMLVTDMIMPGMSGREVAEAVRAARPGIHVLYMSGYLDDAVARHGIKTSVDSFMQKPFTPLSLARKVREILDSEHTRQH